MTGSADETATAAAREAAWLNTTGDSLPWLPVSAGGPWEIIQAYWPGARFPSQKTGIYVLLKSSGDYFVAANRYRPQHLVTLKLVWPVRHNTSPLAETEQQNFDNAISLLRQRIRGPLGDKSHGGAFLSAAQVPQQNPLAVDYDDPETTIPAGQGLRATVSYHIDDQEFTG